MSPESVNVGAAAVAASARRAARAAGDLLAAKRRFEAAFARWRGEPFEDWRTAGWAGGERRRLADLQVSILETRVDVDLDLGRHRELVPTVPWPFSAFAIAVSRRGCRHSILLMT